MPDPGPPPIAVGTPLVEGLTSVGRRLAERHVRTVSGLLALHVPCGHEVEGRRIPRFIVTSLTEAINGASSLTATIVSRLSAELHLPHLRDTTLLETANELFANADFRCIRAWCPLCIAETPYDPLLWSLTHATVCPRHRILLVSSPDCGHIHRPWALRAKPAECAVCDMPLSQAKTDPADVDPLTRACIAIVGRLQAGKPIRRTAVTAGVRHLTSSSLSKPTRLATVTGLSMATIQSLRSGAKAPTLSTIVRLVAHAISLDELLAYGDAEIHPLARSAARVARRNVPGLEPALRAEALLAPSQRRSLAAIAAEFGVGDRYPAKHFPALVEAWDRPGNRRRGRRRAESR